MYKIEKGIPITHKHRGIRKDSKYPLREMEIEDSFFIKCNKDKAKTLASSIIIMSKRIPGMKVTTHFSPEENGLRIWRI